MYCLFVVVYVFDCADECRSVVLAQLLAVWYYRYVVPPPASGG